MSFDKDFIWGIASSAAQVEGGADKDGRSPSIWDTFAQTSHKMMNRRLFPTACNSYELFDRDLDNLKRLGVNSYRMSISWSRVLPDGIGQLNQKGLDYYKRVFEKLNEADIMPNVTLYHWDLPQVLEDKGGWVNRDCVEWFSEYAEKMFLQFSDIVPMWTTINEPIATYVGYAKGNFAPGRKNEKEGNQARHNLLVAHGKGVEVFRAAADKSSQVGIVIDVWKRYPVLPTPENLNEVQDQDERNWKFYTDAVLGNGYSDYILSALEKEGTLMDIHPEDYRIMQQPIDFYGLNIYNRVVVNKDKHPSKSLVRGGNIQAEKGGYYPKCIYDVVKMLRENYSLQIPIYVTENGCPRYVHEFKGLNGIINDNYRIKYFKDYLHWIDKANDDGLNIKGYYAWSLMDNIEWSAGTFMRYGLIHTNFRNFKTTWKKSAYFYRDFIAEHKN